MDRRSAEILGGISTTGWGGLGGQLAHAGKETKLSRVYVDQDREDQVHEMHPSIWVDPE